MTDMKTDGHRKQMEWVGLLCIHSILAEHTYIHYGWLGWGGLSG